MAFLMPSGAGEERMMTFGTGNQLAEGKDNVYISCTTIGSGDLLCECKIVI